jgi:ABC-type nitrate/sulfonate/bicarbonate transport system permease component
LPGVGLWFRCSLSAEARLKASELGAYLRAGIAKGLIDMSMAGILWTLLLGYVLYAAALWLERRLLRWRTLGDQA